MQNTSAVIQQKCPDKNFFAAPALKGVYFFVQALHGRDMTGKVTLQYLSVNLPVLGNSDLLTLKSFQLSKNMP